MRDRRKLIAVAAAAAALTATATVLANGHDERGHASPHVTHAESVPAAEASRFAVLRRARVAADTLPPGVRQVLDADPAVSSRFGAHLDLSRRTGAGSWLLPGDRAICLVRLNANDGTTGMVCNTVQQAAEDGLVAWEFHGRESGTVAGVVPDRVESVRIDGPGSGHTIDVDGNWFEATFTPRTEGLSFVGPDGKASRAVRPGGSRTRRGS